MHNFYAAVVIAVVIAVAVVRYILHAVVTTVVYNYNYIQQIIRFFIQEQFLSHLAALVFHL